MTGEQTVAVFSVALPLSYRDFRPGRDSNPRHTAYEGTATYTTGQGGCCSTAQHARPKMSRGKSGDGMWCPATGRPEPCITQGRNRTCVSRVPGDVSVAFATGRDSCAHEILRRGTSEKSSEHGPLPHGTLSFGTTPPPHAVIGLPAGSPNPAFAPSFVEEVTLFFHHRHNLLSELETTLSQSLQNNFCGAAGSPQQLSD